jgi:hypothetical protein
MLTSFTFRFQPYSTFSHSANRHIFVSCELFRFNLLWVQTVEKFSSLLLYFVNTLDALALEFLRGQRLDLMASSAQQICSKLNVVFTGRDSEMHAAARNAAALADN